MTDTLTLSIIEIVLLLFGAIILGITVHFFIASRRNLNAQSNDLRQKNKQRDEWKIRYLNDIEQRDRDISDLREQVTKRNNDLSELRDALKESRETTEIYTNEAVEARTNYKQLRIEMQQLQENQLKPVAPVDDTELVNQLRSENKRLKNELEVAADYASDDLRAENARLRQELENARHSGVAVASSNGKPDYLEQLRLAQDSLMEHNKKINDLLGNIDVIKEKEEKEREILHDKEVLAAEVDQMREELHEKEKEITNIRQKEKLTIEMTSMLDSAYNDFKVLQDKLSKLEQQLSSARQVNMEVDDLREEHTNALRELEVLRLKNGSLVSSNQQLEIQLTEADEKFREASFQRQQLQKRVAYLEELNNDLQVVSDANKKLETQLRKIGELESALNMVSEERDQLAQRMVR
ncbi:MAG: hypothetical protein EOO09_06120 [Chitinophagaceae bacterium]|nr:MAG: hypothetical protein EOO09_06120 [Chitinophagaceae bacterium]